MDKLNTDNGFQLIFHLYFRKDWFFQKFQHRRNFFCRQPLWYISIFSLFVFPFLPFFSVTPSYDPLLPFYSWLSISSCAVILKKSFWNKEEISIRICCHYLDYPLFLIFFLHLIGFTKIHLFLHHINCMKNWLKTVFLWANEFLSTGANRYVVHYSHNIFWVSNHVSFYLVKYSLKILILIYFLIWPNN